jgi:hypothetical protein
LTTTATVELLALSPGATATDATVPAMGEVSRALSRADSARTRAARCVSISDWSRASVAAVAVPDDDEGESLGVLDDVAADALEKLTAAVLTKLAGVACPVGGEVLDGELFGDEVVGEELFGETVRRAADKDCVKVAIAFSTLC